MKLKTTLLVILIAFLISCKQKNESSAIVNYQKKSNELINQISIQFKESNCILEPSSGESILKTISDEDPSRNYRKKLKEALKIKSDSAFDRMNKLSENYVSDSSLKSKFKLIKREEIESTLKKHGAEKAHEILFKKCPKGWSSFSPPIFNEKFDIAIISIGINNGGTISVYKLQNGKWIYVRSLTSWIS